MQKELAIEVRTALADRASIDLLAKWMLTPEPSRAALPAELGSILAGLRSVDPDLATAFERCVDSGFVAGVLRWPETAAMWRALSARFLSEPDRELLVATQVWRGSHHAQPVAAALV
jgi:hypothetical protein